MSIASHIDCLASSLGIPDYTMATIIVSFIVFGSGIIVNSISRSMQRSRKRKMWRLVVLSGLKNASKQLSVKRNSFENFSNDLTRNEAVNYKFKDVVIPYYEEIKNIPLDTMLGAFSSGNWITQHWQGKRKRKKIEKISDLMKSLKLLSALEGRYSKDIERFGEMNSTYEREWRSQLKQIGLLYRQGCVRAYESGFDENEVKELKAFLSKIAVVYANTLQLDNASDIHVTQRNYISGIHEIIKASAVNKDTYPFIQPILDANMAFNNYRHVREQYAEIFKSMATRCEEIRIEFNKFAGYFPN